MSRSDETHPRILTPDQRPRVFVSSTLQELAPERAAARSAIERLGLIPVMFELGARPHAARALYRAYLAQSHVFVGLYFESYGWVAPDEAVSGLEDEYRLSQGLPRLVYIKSPAPNREQRLANLLDTVREDDDVTYKSFASPAELEVLLAQDLAVLMGESFLLGRPHQLAVANTHTAAPLNRPLPTPVDTLIGRELELAALHDLLRQDHRLICIVGPGGIGKTRLALEAAREVADQNDVWVEFVSLANVEEAVDVLPAVAASIGLGLDGGVRALDAVAGAFGTRPALLVLDNFEHLLAAGTELAELLARCPGLVALVTSRASLHLRGEQLYPLGPLSLPAHGETVSESAAVNLFAARAKALRPDFTLGDPSTAQAVAELCRRLEGIPLAIELAAGRSRLLPPQTLLDRIVSALELGEGPADLPARQRTLRDTMAWSEQLLEPHQRELLAALSVFSTPWTLADAQSVSRSTDDDTFETVAALIENSLVTSADSPAEPRFRMFNVVRDYAGERLDELGLRDEIENAFYRRMISQVPAYLNGLWSADPARWRAEFRLVWPDLRRAWALALARCDREHAAAAASLGTPLWLEGRNTESVELLARSVELDTASGGPRHGMLLINAAQSALYFGQFAQARELLTAIDFSTVPQEMRKFAAGVVEMLHGYVASETGDLATAEDRLVNATRMLAASDGANAQWVGAFAHNGLGSLELARGDVAAASQQFHESEHLAKTSGNLSAEVQSLTLTASIALHQGSIDKAGDLLRATVPLIEQQPFYEGNAYCLETAARYALAHERPSIAAEALGLATALRDLTGASTWAMLQRQSEAVLESVRDAMGEQAFTAAFNKGRSADPRASARMVMHAISPAQGSGEAGAEAR